MHIHHTAITVRSLTESIAFYSEIFGLVVVQEGERVDLGCKIVQMADEKGIILELFEFQNAGPLVRPVELNQEGITHIAFAVDDIETTAEDFAKKGFAADIITGKMARYFFIKDPTGVNIELYEKL